MTPRNVPRAKMADGGRSSLGVQERRDRDRRRLAVALRGGMAWAESAGGLWTPDEVQARAVEHPRVRPRLATVAGLTVDLRDAPERPPERFRAPEDIGSRLTFCRAETVLMQKGGAFVAVPVGCSMGVCPCCVAARSARKASSSLGLWLGLARIPGARVVHMTSTGEAVGWDEPPTLTAREAVAGAYSDPDAPSWGDVGPACGGPSLRASLDRVGGMWRDIRQWRRDLFRPMLGSLIGREATGREPRARPWRVRWHGHSHGLMVLGPEAGPLSVERDRVVGPWVDEVVGAWCRIAAQRGWKATPDAQYVRPVAGFGTFDDAEVARALRQTVKYPCAIHACTTAQLIEAAYGLWGLHGQEPGGAIRSRKPPEEVAAVLEAHRAAEASREKGVRLYVRDIQAGTDAADMWRPASGAWCLAAEREPDGEVWVSFGEPGRDAIKVRASLLQEAARKGRSNADDDDIELSTVETD